MLKKILGSLVGPIKDLVSEIVVDRDEKKRINARIDELSMEFAQRYEEELTKRHEMDMTSDSWLSKNVRPMTLIFLMFVFVLISFFDGNIGTFSLEKTYIPVYETLLTMVFIFYFGSRGIEKSMKIYKREKKE